MSFWTIYFIFAFAFQTGMTMYLYRQEVINKFNSYLSQRKESRKPKLYVIVNNDENFVRTPPRGNLRLVVANGKILSDRTNATDVKKAS